MKDMLVEQLIVEDEPVRHCPEFAETWMGPGLVRRQPETEQGRTGPPSAGLYKGARGLFLA